MASPDKAGLLQQSQSQSKRGLKLELSRPAEFAIDDDEGDDANVGLLGSRSDQDEEGENPRGRLLGNNLYIDSPRGAGPDESDLSDDEIRRRRRVGWTVLAGLFMSILTCVMLLHYLSNQESFGALPPIMQRLLGSTTTKGVKESLEQYTAGVRHTGTTGSEDFAKYIRAKAIDFGIDESFIKLDRFEIMVNEPEVLKLELRSVPRKSKSTPTPAATSAALLSYDFMASFKARGKSKTRAFPPFHLYGKNGSAAGGVVYAHFGGSEDYAALAQANVSVAGRIVLVRMGGGISLPAKVLLAGKFGAAAVLTFNDPADDGAGRGKTMPDGPWRVAGEAAYGSVYMGNGDPSTLDSGSEFVEDRMTVDEVFSENNTFNLLPPVPSMPVSATVVKELLAHATKLNSSSHTNRSAPAVFSGRWPESGGLVNSTFSVELFSGSRNGNGSAVVASMESTSKYVLRNVTNVLVTIQGTREADRYVIVGAQRDSTAASVGGAGSGNAVFLEVLRALGDLVSNGWRPHRTLLLASFDGEQFGSVGSSAWIDRHFSHLGGRGVIYLNMHDVVRGSGSLHCEAAGSLRKNVYLVSAAIAQPETQVDVASFFSSATKTKRRLDVDSSVTTVAVSANGAVASTKDGAVSTSSASDASDEPGLSLLPLNTTFGREDLPDSDDSVFSYWLEHTRELHDFEKAELPVVDLPGVTGRISPFLARLAIPTVELDFDGGYFGVEGSANDTFEWMSKFGDPSFGFHRAAAQLYGSVLLSFSDAIFLQYDFTEVARDLRHAEAYLVSALQRTGMSATISLNRLHSAISSFELAAVAVNEEMHEMSEAMVSALNGELVVDFKRVREMNTRLLLTEKAFLLPAGPPREPWLKHALYGFSEWDDYRAGYFPSVTQQLADGNSMTARRELTRLCVAIEQAADTLSTTVL